MKRLILTLLLVFRLWTLPLWGAQLQLFRVQNQTPNTPVDSPGAGTYSSTQSVTITDANAAFILYTLTGTAPSCPATGTLYTGAFNISTTSTLKAIGCNGADGGSVLTSVYTISATCGNGYLHCAAITWDATQAGTADTSTFAGLVQFTEAQWATSAHSGQVQNTVNQSGGSYTSTIPADFIFTSDAGCTTKLTAWEFESYNATTGAVIAWVNIGTLSHSTNTVIEACWDDSSTTTQQATVSSTWDSNYKAVYHFGGTLGLADSSSSGLTLTNTDASVTSGTGEIGNGAVNTTDNGLVSAAFTLGVNVVTIEAWVFSSTMTTQTTAMFVEKSTVNTQWQLFDTTGTLTLRGASGTDLTATPLSNSTWTYIGGSITGTSGVGYIQGTATSHAVTAFTDASSVMHLGNYDASAGTFTGTLDEVRISKAVRAGSYFTAHYNQEKPSQTMVTIGTLN